MWSAFCITRGDLLEQVLQLSRSIPAQNSKGAHPEGKKQQRRSKNRRCLVEDDGEYHPMLGLRGSF